ncbi:MAG: RNA-binding domain-containing protein [Gemmatimonadota bacterium]
MTPEQLRELIAAGETLDVEFKGEAKKALSDSDLVDAVVCLSNRPGAEPGWLLVGVEDDGRITGARPRHEAGSTDIRRLQAVIANLTRPSVSCRADVFALDDQQVIAIEVSPSRHPVGRSNGLYVRRAVGSDGRPACVPYPFHEMQSHEADRGQLDYSTAVVPEARWADLDPLEFERYRRNIRESRGQGDRSLLDLTDIELAKALGAVVANGEVSAVRVLGLLLFGREEALRSLIPTHEVAFQQLAGQKVEANDFLRLPLVRTMEELLGRWRARNREQELMVGALRVGVPDYPELALREAVANALIHRDYTRLGAVHVQWHEDRIASPVPAVFPRACASTTCS